MALQKITSLSDLRNRCFTSDSYRHLAAVASRNLGGPSEPLPACLNWLELNAMETDEAGVVDEVNFVLDLASAKKK